MADRPSKATLREEVKKHIIKGVTNGTYQFGERLVETKLAKELQMSQAPVREALLELSIQGILEDRPYAGSFVKKPEIKDVENHYAVRSVIESYAASLAAENRTDEELQNMRFILHEMSECDDIEEFVDLDHAFHGLIMDASRNNVLKRIWLSISAYESTYQSALSNRWTIQDMYELHRKLYDVIASGNSRAAEAEMYLHIAGFRDGVIANMREQVEKSENLNVPEEV